ncbi:MAG: HAD hydrolase-like protein, partial [Bacteroidaceae bacterium]|nr:HAD hydrolase-like protein [Bacteroidaceae bacterium]
MTHQQHLNIIFDLDGTLLNTLDDLTASTNHALQVCGYPPHTTQEVRLMVGNGIAKLIERAVPQGTSEASTLHCLDIFRQHYTEHCLDRTLPYPGVTEMLSEFKRRNLGLAIVSNKLQPAVSELRERFFADCINIAVGETKQV